MFFLEKFSLKEVMPMTKENIIAGILAGILFLLTIFSMI